MPILYAVKRVIRSWKLFLALLIGIILASTFFAGIDVKANLTAKQALDQGLRNVYDDMEFYAYDLNSTQLSAVRAGVAAVEGVKGVEAICRLPWWQITIHGQNSSLEMPIMVAAVGDNSHVYDGWLNKPSESIGEDEAYLLEGYGAEGDVRVGDTVQMNFSSYLSLGNSTTATLNFTVKGFVQLDDEAYSLASGYKSWILPFGVSVGPSIPRSELLLIRWGAVFDDLIDSGFVREVQKTFLIYLNREALIDPWDMQTSLSNVEVVKNSISKKLSTDLGVYADVTDNLQAPLQAFQFNFMLIRFSFTIVSLPIFFIAWYMGTTVSDISFNLRRREIGLLSTKGFSRGQILRTFLIETVIVGIAGGVIGVFLGYVLAGFFTQFGAESMSISTLISPYTIGSTIILGVLIALLSVYSSAKKASRLSAVDALKEYLPAEIEKAYKKRWPLVAFVLGTYKMVVFILGLNMSVLLSSAMFGSGNFLVMVFGGLFMFLDMILNYIGPVLFFWGASKLLIQGSLKFQELTTRAAKFLGELGTLAAKNVRRNPARSAAIAFLIALIVSYSVQVSGQLASDADFNARTVYLNVGADVSVNPPNASVAADVSSKIYANLSSSIENITAEYSFSGMTGFLGYVYFKAVEPESWLKTAYYEGGWFSGSDVATAFKELGSDNDTIILRKAYATLYRLALGDEVEVSLSYNVTRKLRIVGFFGPDISQSQQGGFSVYWCFVPEGLYKEIGGSSDVSARVLLKLKSGVDGKMVAQSIRNLGLETSSVQSFAEEYAESQSNVLQVGTLEVQRLGIFFAVLSASVGTTLVSVVSLQERKREATIMSIRGLSYKQLLVMFLTENVAVVVFSVLLGVFVGFVAFYGNVAANNAFLTDPLITRRVVFPLDSTLTLAFCLSLIFASTILPVLIISRRYVTKLERMSRSR